MRTNKGLGIAVCGVASLLILAGLSLRRLGGDGDSPVVGWSLPGFDGTPPEPPAVSMPEAERGGPEAFPSEFSEGQAPEAGPAPGELSARAAAPERRELELFSGGGEGGSAGAGAGPAGGFAGDSAGGKGASERAGGKRLGGGGPRSVSGAGGETQGLDIAQAAMPAARAGGSPKRGGAAASPVGAAPVLEQAPLPPELESLLKQARAQAKLSQKQIGQLRAVRAAAEQEIEKVMEKAERLSQKSAPGAQAASVTFTGRRLWPVEGRVTQEFGPNNWGIYAGRTYQGKYYPHFHNGMDIASPMGTPIRAFTDGEVAFVGVSKGYGINVIVSHADGLSTLYAHMDGGARSPPVRAGDKVAAGQTVGHVGMTGMTTGPHLHFVARKGDVLNPRAVLPK